MSPRENFERHEFFVPGEVCYFFEHDPKETDHIDERLREDPALRELIERPAFRCLDMQTFEPVEGARNAYTLVYGELPKPREMNDEQRRSLHQRVIEVIDDGNEGVRRGRYKDSPLRLTAVTPNWFSGAAQGHFVDGGPGARPVPTAVGKNQLPELTADFVNDQINQHLSAQKAGPTEVDVYVLDSIPMLNSWLRMHQRSERLTELLNKMEIRSATDLGVVLPTHDYGIAGHDYEMSDHGLFIAGLIHDSAPDANIHLFEVLNNYGVGTMKSLLAGLLAIPNIKRPTIINCSLMMAVRSSTLTRTFPGWKRLADAEPDSRSQRFTAKQLRMPLNNYLGAMMQPLETLIQQRIAALGGNSLVKMVASAGNDSNGDTSRKPARYPAAFDKVIGVGALDRNNKPAAYSNYADNPLNEGIAAFGGLADMATDTADPADGIAGVFIGNFPDGSASATGTARWAGTSFAAGVVSGLLARLCSAGFSCDEAEKILRSERKFDVPDLITTKEQ